jgi:hypothetical protein
MDRYNLLNYLKCVPFVLLISDALLQERCTSLVGRIVGVVRFQVLTAASMMFRAVFWVVMPCKMTHSSLMMEAGRTSETSVANHFTRQYNPEDSSEHQANSNFRRFSNRILANYEN